MASRRLPEEPPHRAGICPTRRFGARKTVTRPGCPGAALKVVLTTPAVGRPLLRPSCLGLSFSILNKALETHSKGLPVESRTPDGLVKKPELVWLSGLSASL